MSRLAVPFSLLFILLVLASATASPPSQKDKPRESADGVAFPAAVERRFDVRLPLVNRRLGGLPEEFASRVFHTETSSTLLKKRSLSIPDTEWFVLGLQGADVVGFELTDGRVTKVRYYFKNIGSRRVDRLYTKILNAAKAANAEHYLRELGGRAFHSGLAFSVGGTKVRFLSFFASDLRNPNRKRELDSTTITIMFYPEDWFALYPDLHDDVDRRIAEAIVEKRPAIGMTLEQAKQIFGKPDGTDQLGDKTTRYTWVQSHIRPGRSTITGRVIVPAQKIIDRIITADFEDGIIVAFSDQSY